MTAETGQRPKANSTFPDASDLKLVLSFDVEDHHRIEAAAGLHIHPTLQAHHRERVEPSTRWLLDRLNERGIRSTFFILGEIAHRNPRLIRAIHNAGHEIASHGWDHQRLHTLTPASFQEDVRKSKHALEQASGTRVVGYRAPTFSLVRQTAWAIDVLVECGIKYDSSIYPVRHDRYGVPEAPRGPFWAKGEGHSILELPPLTLRMFGANLPTGGGGYSRLFPTRVINWALRQVELGSSPRIAMLYFHPWEFDPQQPRLPLSGFRRFRTYAGISRTRGRLPLLLERSGFIRASDAAALSAASIDPLPCFPLGEGERSQ